MRKSIFLLIDLKPSREGKRLVLPISLLALDDMLTSLGHLARLVLWLVPGVTRKMEASLGIDPEMAIDTASGVLSELRSCGSWTMVDVKSRGTRVLIRFY